MLGCKVPITFVCQFLDLFIVDVLFRVVQFSRKYCIASHFQAVEHVKEHFFVISHIIDHARHHHKVKLTFKLWINLVIRLTNNHSLKIKVLVLTLGDL